MNKAVAGLKVGLVLVMAMVIGMVLVSLWIVLGWMDTCIVVLLAVGVSVVWIMLKRKGGRK